MMYTYGGHLYMLGGWTYDGCRNYHYRCRAIELLIYRAPTHSSFTHSRISESGSSWAGRAAYERNIHRHTAVVDEQQAALSWGCIT